MSLNNDLLKELLEEIKKLNKTHESILIHVENTSDSVHYIQQDSSKIYYTVESIVEAVSPSPRITTCRHGYANWINAQDPIKAMQWQKVSQLFDFIENIDIDVEKDIVKVNENTRFPVPVPSDDIGVYINLNHPLLKAAMWNLKRFTSDINRNRLWDVLKTCEMHTRASFEEKHKLIWIE